MKFTSLSFWQTDRIWKLLLVWVADILYFIIRVYFPTSGVQNLIFSWLAFQFSLFMYHTVVFLPPVIPSRPGLKEEVRLCGIMLQGWRFSQWCSWSFNSYTTWHWHSVCSCWCFKGYWFSNLQHQAAHEECLLHTAWTAWRWIWRHYDPFQHQVLFPPKHSVTS